MCLDHSETIPLPPGPWKNVKKCGYHWTSELNIINQTAQAPQRLYWAHREEMMLFVKVEEIHSI